MISASLAAHLLQVLSLVHPFLYDFNAVIIE
jgi:hypothetical protein